MAHSERNNKITEFIISRPCYSANGQKSRSETIFQCLRHGCMVVRSECRSSDSIEQCSDFAFDGNETPHMVGVCCCFIYFAEVALRGEGGGVSENASHAHAARLSASRQ